MILRQTNFETQENWMEIIKTTTKKGIGKNRHNRYVLTNKQFKECQGQWKEMWKREKNSSRNWNRITIKDAYEIKQEVIMVKLNRKNHNREETLKVCDT